METSINLKNGTKVPGQNVQEESLLLYKNSQRKHDKTTDANNILLILLKFLQEYSTNSSANPDIKETFYRPIGAVEDQFTKDINNNIGSKNTSVTKVGSNTNINKHHLSRHQVPPDDSNIREKRFNCVRRCYNTKKSYCNVYNKSRPEKAAKKTLDVNAIEERNRSSKLTEKNNCTCSGDKKCYQNIECSYQCCGRNFPRSVEVKTSNSLSFQSGSVSIPIKSAVRDVTSSIEKNINTIYMTRTMQNVGKVGPYKSWDQTKLCSRKQNADDEQQLNAYMRHLGKCREFLNSERSMVNSTNAGVNIADQTDERSTLRPEYENKETREVNSSCSIDCQNDCMDLKCCISDTFPLIIKDGEGLVEIHIIKLQLSTSAVQILNRNNEIDNTSLFISWNIWEQETTRTIPKKCTKLNFNSSFVYRIPDLFDFFNCVLSKHVVFQVNIHQENEENCMVARAKLCIKDILDYPQNKLHYIAPMNSVLPCFLGTNFGQLSLWIRLSCNIEKVDAFKKKCGFYLPSGHIESIINSEPRKALHELKFSPHFLEDTQDLEEQDPGKSSEYKDPLNTIGSVKETEELLQERSPIPEEKDESAVILPEIHPTPTVTPDVKKKAEKDESDLEISSELLNFDRSSSIIDVMDNEDESSGNERTDKKFRESVKIELPVEEGKERKEVGAQAETSSLIEFDAFLKNRKCNKMTSQETNDTIRDITEVLSDTNWEEYRPPEKDAITIEIVNMILFQKSSVMQDDDIQMLYVEYNFLGYYGAEMETVSVAKPKLPNQKMTFNLIRKFQIDEETRAAKRKTLRAMLKRSINPNIRFVVVSEPLPEETNTKECTEVGYADFNIREYALGAGNKSVSLPIMNYEASEQIGVLKIYVLGIDAIRQCLGENE